MLGLSFEYRLTVTDSNGEYGVALWGTIKSVWVTMSYY